MKKIILSAIMAAAVFGCQSISDDVTPIAQEGIFTASMEPFEQQTKTSMTELRNVVWSTGDRIAIFQGSSLADTYQVTDASVGKSNGTFKIATDNSSDINGDFSSGVELSANIAFYPYTYGMSCVNAAVTDSETGSEVTAYSIEGAVLPSVQNYSANSFGNETFPMVAVTRSISDHNLNFKNVCGAIKLQLKGTQTIKLIVIEGKNNEKLSGTAMVTAYTDGTKPAIAMASDASTSVTLDCGDGVQLNEEAATEFIISLPPVLFSKGFTVKVTDSDSRTYTVETDKANTVLRSSILVMPVVKLGEIGGAPEEDEDVIPVLKIVMVKTSLKLPPEASYTLTAEVVPAEATHKTLTWSSSVPSVATVDQNGVVTALSDGETVITAEAGGVTSTCSVTVFSPATATADYVDEYGVNHGKGIAIGLHVWAPVNCGYHATEYPYGKLYQWGRKYGQGLGGDYDAHEPVLMEGPIDLDAGQNKAMANYFFYGNGYWLSIGNDSLWNSGTESSPIKTGYDPCPEGWRVPTKGELTDLASFHSDFTTNEGLKGMWFSGAGYDVQLSDGQVFLPASGYRYHDGIHVDVGINGLYWSASPDDNYYAYSLHFANNGFVSSLYSYLHASGYSVRCLQVIDEVAGANAEE